MIILFVWFHVLSINTIFFSAFSLLGNLSSLMSLLWLGSNFAHLGAGSADKPLLSVLHFVCKERGMLLIETELGPGKISAI